MIHSCDTGHPRRHSVPLVTSSGHVIGSFCVQGPEARSFTEDDLAQLHRYAEQVITRIEQRRQG
jgi:GAF domain-containing protein